MCSFWGRDDFRALCLMAEMTTQALLKLGWVLLPFVARYA
jgi:hypothetical protein